MTDKTQHDDTLEKLQRNEISLGVALNGTRSNRPVDRNPKFTSKVVDRWLQKNKFSSTKRLTVEQRVAIYLDYLSNPLIVTNHNHRNYK